LFWYLASFVRDQTNLVFEQTCSLDICITILHLAFVHVSVRKGQLSGNRTKVTQHKTKLVTFVGGIKESGG